MAIIQNLVARLSLDSKAFDRNAKKSSQSMRSMQRQSLALQKGIINLAGAYLGVRGLNRAMGSMIREASKAQETQSKFDTVFRHNAEAANKWANDYAGAIGRSREEIKRYMAELQDTFVPLGYARDESEKLSKNLLQLAIDVASFNNAADQDVLRDLTSALVGSHRAVAKYGIIINETELKQEALNKGIIKQKREMTNAEKVMARMSIMFRSTADAQCDAVRTGGSYANKVKAMAGAWSDLKVSMGEDFLPVATKTVSNLEKLTRAVNKLRMTASTVGDPFTDLQTLPAEFKSDVLRRYERQIKAAHLQRYGLSAANQQPAQNHALLQREIDAARKRMQRREAGMGTIRRDAESKATIPGYGAQASFYADLAPTKGGMLGPLAAEIDYDKVHKTLVYSLKERQEQEERLADEAKRLAADRANAYRNMASDMTRMDEETFGVRLDLLDEELAKYKTYVEDKALLNKWYQQQRDKLEIELDMASDNFLKGMAADLREAQEEMKTFGQMGAQAGKEIREGLGSALNDALWRVNSLEEGIEQAVRSAAMNFTGNLINSGMTSTFNAGGSILASILHDGGTVGSGGRTRRVPAAAFINAPRFHNGGEVPALLKPRERVLTESQASASDRNGAAIVGLLGRLIGAVQETRNITLIDARDRDEMLNQWAASPAGRRALADAMAGVG